MRNCLALVVLLLATPARAQITIPNHFTNGTVADANQVNANFTALGNQALNRTGGAMTGDLIFTDALYDIGKSGATRPRDGFFSRNLVVGGTLAVTGNTTLTATLTVNGFGSHVFSSTGTGSQNIQIRNQTAGTANISSIIIGNDSDAALSFLASTSSTYTPAGPNLASGTLLAANGVGGLSLYAGHASGLIRFYTGGGTERGRMFTTGGFSWGDTTDPGALGFRVAGISQLVGGVLVSAASSATTALDYRVAGISIADIGADFGGGYNLLFQPTLNGAGKNGNSIEIGNNISGGGAPGTLRLRDKSGNVNSVWSDSTGVLRIGTQVVEGVSDTTGTIVGTQTSTLDTKILLDHDLAPADALATILRTPVKRFAYRSGAYSGSVFHGIIADWSPEFAMDPDTAHPGGRSFNPVSAFGYTVEAIKALQAQIDALKAARP